MTRDFSQGAIAPTLGLFSFPIMLANLLQASMQLINGLWVGNLLGASAFAAVTVSTSGMMVVLAFVLGINNATLTLFAQLRGKSDLSTIRAYLSTFTIILTALSIVIGGLGYLFTDSLLALLNSPPEITDDASIYLKISFAGTFFLVGYNFIGTVLRAFGDSKTPLYFVLLGTLLSALFAPLLIAGLETGVGGAAYALLAAHALTFLYSLVYLRRKFRSYTFKLQSPKLSEIKTIFQLGIPSGAQMIVIYTGMTAIISLVNTLGTHAVAGYGAAQRLDNLILLPAVALGTAVNAMAAHNIGAQHWTRVAQISRIGIAYNLSIMLTLAIILFVWAEPLVRLFIQDEESVSFGKSYLKTIAFFYPFLGLNFVFNGVVRGSGAMWQVLTLNIVSLWILRVPLTYWATARFGEIGVALGVGTSFFLSCLFSLGYYHWGGWRNKKLFK